MSSTTLTAASREWASRPPDQRFTSLSDLDAKAQFFKAQAREAADVPFSTLRVSADSGGLKLIGKANVPSDFTHWSFGQTARLIKAPADYLRDLPATLAAQNMNHGLARRGEAGDKVSLLLHANGGYTVRALTSDSYTRIWNADITSRLVRLSQQFPEWQPAPAAYDGSRGLYLSQHDMFAFLVDNNRRIFEQDPGGGLSRGFFVTNSEVGAASFRITSFLYAYVCGNHLVWGASGVKEFILRHTGKADERAFSALSYELREYANASALDDEAAIVKARGTVLGKDKDSVLDRVFGLKIPALTRKVLCAALDVAEAREDRYGDPRSLWGVVNGITEHAQTVEEADTRTGLDRAAGKLMQVAF